MPQWQVESLRFRVCCRLVSHMHVADYLLHHGEARHGGVGHAGRVVRRTAVCGRLGAKLCLRRMAAATAVLPLGIATPTRCCWPHELRRVKVPPTCNLPDAGQETAMCKPCSLTCALAQSPRPATSAHKRIAQDGWGARGCRASYEREPLSLTHTHSLAPIHILKSKP